MNWGDWIVEKGTAAVTSQVQVWLESNALSLVLWVIAGVVALILLRRFGKWIAGAVVVLIIGAVLVMSSAASATQATATSAVAEAAGRGGFGAGSVILTTALVTLLCVAGAWGAWQYSKRQKKAGAGEISLPGLGQIDASTLLTLLVTQMLQGQRGQVQASPPSVVVVNGPVPERRRQADTWEAERQPAALGWADDEGDAGGFTWGE